MQKTISKKEEDFYECERCKISTSTEDRMCPCPRGGCDAKITGTLIKITILDTELSKEQIEWNEVY